MTTIETEYNSRMFRSRWEARWAVFFDCLGIEWCYEPEGFEMSDGTRYLPDFYVPSVDSFVEVKGLFSNKDRHKVEMFRNESGKPLVILDGEPAMLLRDGFRGYDVNECGGVFIVETREGYGFSRNGQDGFWHEKMGWNPSVLEAAKTATMSRFEHGETRTDLATIHADRAIESARRRAEKKLKGAKSVRSW